MARFVFLALLALGWPSNYGNAQEEQPLTAEDCIGPQRPADLMKSLMEGYHKDDRPSLYLPRTKGKAVPPEEATVQVHVLSLSDVDQTKGVFELNIVLHRYWNDPRLAFMTESEGGCFEDNKPVGYKAPVLDDIWKPDFFIENQGDKIKYTIGEGVWISPNGNVLWSNQFRVKLTCEMDFVVYPYDIQTCGLVIALYADKEQDVHIDFVHRLQAITLPGDRDGWGESIPQGGTPEWNILDAYAVSQNAEDLDSAGEVDASVEFRFTLRRNHEYYSAFVFQPCVMMVIIGYASFFVNRSAAPARVAMSTMGFLANTNFLVSQLGQIPRLGRDVFLLRFIQMCACFCFYAIIEYALCNYLRRIQNRLDGQRKRISENKGSEELHKTTDEEEEQPKDRRGAYKGVTKNDLIESGFNKKIDLLLLSPKTGKMYLRDEHVDIFSRWCYPFAYMFAWIGLYYSM